MGNSSGVNLSQDDISSGDISIRKSAEDDLRNLIIAQKPQSLNETCKLNLQVIQIRLFE